jgi:hypothetical protein
MPESKQIGSAKSKQLGFFKKLKDSRKLYPDCKLQQPGRNS